MRHLFFALAASAACVAPATASTVFSDGFNGENGGLTALNYAGFANFGVTGNVDLVKTPDYGISCAGGSGLCVDLDGTTGPGRITSIASFSFNAGDVVRFSYDLSGNQRGGGGDDWYSGFNFAGATQINNYGFNYAGTDVIIGSYSTNSINTSSSAVLGNAFTTKSVFFTAGTAGTLQFFVGTNSADNVGPIVDNATLDISAVPEPATWTMMIAGFGLAGGMVRRGRHAGRLLARQA